jgi:hypothetical protein
MTCSLALHPPFGPLLALGKKFCFIHPPMLPFRWALVPARSRAQYALSSLFSLRSCVCSPFCALCSCLFFCSSPFFLFRFCYPSACVFVGVCVYIYICVCKYVCIYIYGSGWAAITMLIVKSGVGCERVMGWWVVTYRRVLVVVWVECSCTIIRPVVTLGGSSRSDGRACLWNPSWLPK